MILTVENEKCPIGFSSRAFVFAKACHSEAFCPCHTEALAECIYGRKGERIYAFALFFFRNTRNNTSPNTVMAAPMP